MGVKANGKVEERRVRVASLLIERYSIREIARRLDVPRSTIARDVVAVRAEWMEARIENADLVVAGELKRLEAAERVLWPMIRFGDLTAVDRLLRIMDRRAKLLGLDAPTKIDITDRIREMAKDAGLSDEDATQAVLEAERMMRAQA